MGTNDFKIKSKQTCQEKWGVDNTFQSKECKDKIKQTFLDKYGVEFPLQVAEIKQRVFESKHKLLNQTDIKLGCSQNFVPNIGKNETQILNKIEFTQNICIIRQYPVCGSFVDGYCKETNTVYEVDESYHLAEDQTKKDSIRQEKIINELNCKFIRITD